VKEKDILDIEGMGSKGLEEIKTVLEGLGLSLKA
jgi:DNA-directed RNA polymerase alpha subunit